MKPWIATVAVACLVACGAEPSLPADLVLRNGRIVTLDDKTPEAQALAAAGGRIVAVGSDEEVSKRIGPSTRVIDLTGALAIPGWIEGHGHFMGVGEAKLQLDLMGVKNWDEVIALVAEAVKTAKPGELVRGRGWHQEKWDRMPKSAVEGIPTHHSLSAVSPNHPVILRHASGHASFANAKAMELAGITRDTKDPPGGTILRGPKREPTGYFREKAAGLLDKAAAAATPADPRKVARAAIEATLSNGVTSFQDAGSSLEEVKLFKELAAEGALGVRLWVMLREPNEKLARALKELRTVGFGDHHLTVRAIKKQIDGALGSHGAWLLAPYNDLKESAGLNTTPIQEIEETARLAMANDYQLCVHAIGDRGNREMLDLFERTFKANPGKTGLRWRIEHAQHVDPADIPRFAKLGVIASMQGVHCTSDGPWVPKRIGEKRAKEGAYVWRSLLDSGAVVSNGTDAPVERISPIECYYATVTRRMSDGKAFFPEQCMTRLEALRSYTLSCAYAAFEEDLKGSLSPGKLADVTVLSKDILKVPEEEILKAEVLYTIVGGKVMKEPN